MRWVTSRFTSMNFKVSRLIDRAYVKGSRMYCGAGVGSKELVVDLFCTQSLNLAPSRGRRNLLRQRSVCLFSVRSLFDDFRRQPLRLGRADNSIRAVLRSRGTLLPAATHRLLRQYRAVSGGR